MNTKPKTLEQRLTLLNKVLENNIDRLDMELQYSYQKKEEIVHCVRRIKRIYKVLNKHAPYFNVREAQYGADSL